MKSLDLNEPVKSSEFTGSIEPASQAGEMTASQILDEKRKIVELSNDSVMHGYDIAIQLLASHGNVDAVKLLGENRAIIEVGLQNSVDERLK